MGNRLHLVCVIRLVLVSNLNLLREISVLRVSVILWLPRALIIESLGLDPARRSLVRINGIFTWSLRKNLRHKVFILLLLLVLVKLVIKIVFGLIVRFKCVG